MTIDELRKVAQGDGWATLVVPCTDRGPPERLFGRCGPLVDVINANASKAVVRVKKVSLRRWLKNNTEGF